MKNVKHFCEDCNGSLLGFKMFECFAGVSRQDCKMERTFQPGSKKFGNSYDRSLF